MNKFKKVLLGALSVLTLGLFVATGAKVNAGTTNTTYTLDAKVGTIADVKQSTAGYFTVAKDGGSASIGGGNCTATFTSIIDGNSYTAVKQTSTVDGIQGIKMESKTTITFTTTVNSTSTVTVLWGNNSSGKNGTTIKFDGTASTNSVDGLNATTTQTWSNVTAGSHTIAAGTNQATVFEIKVVETVTTADGTYTVTYNKNGHGSNVDPNQGVTALANPLPTLSETGYTFGGWYTDSGLSTPAKAGAAISADTTLYAKWDVNTSEWCTITFDSNGGSEVESTTQIYGSTYTLPNCTKSGYYLTGWSDGTNTYTGTYTVPNLSSITLIAQWEEQISMSKDCELSSSTNVTNSNFISITTTTGDPSFQNGKGTASFNGKNFTSNDKGLKFDAKPTLTFTLDKASTVYLVFSTNYSGKKVSFDAALYTESFTIPSDGVVTLKLAKGSHTIRRGDAEVYLFYIGVVETNDTASAVTSSIAAQFDDDSAPTKLRLVGIITGLQPEEYAEISNVTFTFDFNNNVEPYTKRCTQLYKSVASLKSDFAAGDYKLYVVLTISGVDKYVESGDKSIENITMTINFEDGTQKVVTRDNVLLAAKA